MQIPFKIWQESAFYEKDEKTLANCSEMVTRKIKTLETRASYGIADTRKESKVLTMYFEATTL
jgi:hypothetical protein